jgi:hypothetical protein
MSDAIREVQESTIKPYVSMSMGGQYNVLDEDSKVVYSTRDKILAYDYFKKNFDKLKEELQETPQGFALVSKAKEIAKKFANNMSKAVAEIEKLEKGLSNNSSVKDALQKANESLEIDEEVSLQEVSDNLKLAVLKRKIKQYKDKVLKKTMSTIKSPLFAGYEEVEEGRMKDIFTAGEQGKSAEEIAKIMKLPLKTVKNILGEEVFEEQILEFTSDMITRLQKSYSTMPKRISPEQATALSKHLDRLDLASLKQLTKAKIPFVTALARNKVYKKTGKFEEVELEITEQTPAQKATEMLKNLATAAGFKRPSSGDGYQAVFDYRNGKGKYQGKGKKTFKQVQDWIYRNGYRIDMGYLRNMLGEAVEEPKKDMPDDKERVAKESSDKEIASLKDQIAMLKTKLENEKNKAVKPVPNPKTGEVPLTVGVAYKHFRAAEDKEKKEEVSEAITVKKYKNAVDPTKDGLQISKTSGMGGSIFIKDKKELKDLLDKIDKNKGNLKEDAKSDEEKTHDKHLIKKKTKEEMAQVMAELDKMFGMKKGKVVKEVPNCVPEGAVKLVDKLLSKKLKEKQK